MKRLGISILAFLLSGGVAWAVNETSIDMVQLLRKRVGDISTAFALSGCTPAASGLSLAAFACEGNVMDNGFSIPVVQASAGVGPFTGGDGTYWVALGKNTTSPVTGWTRQAGTHYLWRLDATEPATVGGLLVFARVTVASNVVTAIVPLASRTSTPISADIGTPASAYGVVCDGVTPTATALQRVFNTVPVGARVLLPQGTCVLEASLTITQSLTVVGAGMQQTYLSQTVLNAPVLTISALDVHLSGVTLRHVGLPVSGGDGLIVRGPGGAGIQAVTLTDLRADYNWRGFVLGCVAYSQAAHVWANNNESHGFEFLYESACGTSQWDILHAISQLNKGVGFTGVNTLATVGIGPWLTQTVSFGNNAGGYVFQGTAGHGLYDLRLQGVLSSADNVTGILLETYGMGHLVTSPWIELTGVLAGFPIGADLATSVASNTGHCLEAPVNNMPGLTIVGGLYWNCAWSGVALDAPYSSLVGGMSIGNGRALHASLAYRAGVHIGGSGVLVSGHTFGYDAATLHYLHLEHALTDVAIGQNTYMPGLALTDILSFAEATLSQHLPSMVAGLTVHTNTLGAPWLRLYDALNGATPAKHLRAASGNFEVLNAGATAVLQTLSDAGTPGWPARRGQLTIADANTTGTVTLSPTEPDASYFVQLTASAAGGGPAAGALTVGGVNKATGSFVVTLTDAPGAGKSVVYDWFLHR